MYSSTACESWPIAHMVLPRFNEACQCDGSSCTAVLSASAACVRRDSRLSVLPRFNAASCARGAAACASR